MKPTFATLSALAALGLTLGCASSNAPPSAGAVDDGGPDGGTPGDAASDGALDAAPDVADEVTDTRADAPPPGTHRAFPQLVAGKRVITSTRLVTIVAANDDSPTPLSNFSDALITSHWWKEATAEYGAGGVSGNMHVGGPALTASTDVAGLAAYVAASGAPVPDGSTVYLLYLPVGVTATDRTFLSFHAPYPDGATSKGDVLAIVGREKPAPGETQVDSLTKIASHEIAESVTDPNGAGFRLPRASATTPWTSSPWASMQTGTIENGDLCEGSRVREPAEPSGWLYQRSWSNAAAAAGGDPCVPARAATYFDVSAASDWYAGAPGETVSVAIAGWSVSPTANWLLNASMVNSTADLKGLVLGSGFTFSTPLGIGTTGTCNPRQAINDGVAGTMQVTIPSTAVAGDWAVFSIHSFREDPATCNQPVTDDLFSPWLVGVHVL